MLFLVTVALLDRVGNSSDNDDAVAIFSPPSSSHTTSGDFAPDELTKLDKANLDIFWLRDESLEDSENLPPPDQIAGEIVEDLRAALEQMEESAADLGAVETVAVVEELVMEAKPAWRINHRSSRRFVHDYLLATVGAGLTKG